MSAYYDAVHAADEALADALTHIRAREDKHGRSAPPRPPPKESASWKPT
jgi:hypothetical protein